MPFVVVAARVWQLTSASSVVAARIVISRPTLQSSLRRSLPSCTRRGKSCSPMTQLFVRILVAASVIGFFVLNQVQEKIQKRYQPALDSTPPITKPLFVFGKLSMVLSWLMALLQAAGISLRMFVLPDRVTLCGGILLVLGFLWTAAAFSALGNENTIGLPTKETSLRTMGLYRISRNPIYVGFATMSVGAAIYTANIATLVLAAAAIAVHHKIILAEEIFLAARFGAVYEEYRRGRRRYV